MTIHSNIKEEIKEAIKLRDRERLTTLRNIISEFTNETISKGGDRDKDVSDELALEIISKLVKQRRDSIEQFEGAGREDLAQKERHELSILEKYMPEQMTEEDIENYVNKKIKELKIADNTSMGLLMSTVMKDLKGQVDGRVVKRVVEKIIPKES